MGQKEIKEPKIRSVKFNVAMNMILTTSSFLFPLITIPYVSRVLGPSGMGIVSWMQTLITYFSLVAMLGITSYGIRTCAEVRDNKEQLSQTTQELVVILICSTTLVYILYIVALFLIPKTRDNITLAFIFSIGIWLTSCGCDWFYQAIEQYGYITVRNIAFKIIGLILMFLFVHNVSDYILYGITIVIGSYGSNILNLLKLRDFVTFSRKRNLNIKRHIKPMITFTISSISSGMYVQMDMLLSGIFLSNTLVGVYQMIVKIRGICYTAVNSVGSVILPRISYYESQSHHSNTKKLIGKNLNFLFIISFGMMIMLIFCGQPIIQILGGSQYLVGTTALTIASPIILFSATNNTLSQYLIASNHEKEYAVVNICGLILSIIFCCILIPRFGINGAALGIALCEFCTLSIRSFIVRDFIKELREETDFLRILPAILITAVSVWYVQRFIQGLNPFVQLIISGLVFSIIYLSSLIIAREKFILGLLHR
ncbi:Flippase [Bifidobacterium dolichotidis]|uniref:Flippase n=1 Tax=Bifidobacterium dolichotidis TaxID=2306976 RepID=A0A430FRP7_9BIFI|nr:flippase [Bifidobacterium dolichotidis]RSX55525.1 Flippase [Bifidobacterium dolichotidis]